MPPARSRSSRIRGDSGSAAVEFALLAPLLFAVVFGIISFGLLFHQQIQLSGAAREGARTMAIKKDAGLARNAVIAASPTLDQSRMTIAIPATCPVDTTVTVTVSYPFTFQYILGGVNRTLTGRGAMRCGG